MSNVPPITQNFGRPSYRPEAPGLDPDMRRIAAIAGGLGVLVAIAIGGVSLSHRAHHGIPVIEPTPGPVRVKPLDPGGMKVAGAEDVASGVEALAPAAEEPAIRALRAKAHIAPPAGLVPAPIAAVAQAPAVQTQPIQAPASPPAAVATPGLSVQLAAFDTQRAAEQEWGRLSENPGLLDGHRPDLTQAKLAGRTIYRLSTGGFADTAAAAAFCGRVRAKGGTCTFASL